MEKDKYKILIADDEYWTREKLRRMVEWEKYGLIFLEPAVDGEDALRKLEEYRPDILITDINMPYLDGVELQKQIQERFPEVITFVVSGYDDFEYVKESFMAGSINYLIKPISKIDLISAISSALEIISQRQEEKQKLRKVASFLKDREFSQLLEKKETPFVPNITINSNLDYAGVTLILLKIHNLKPLSAACHYDMNQLSWSMKNRIRELLQDEGSIIFNHVYRSNEFIIVSEKENQELRQRFGRLAASLEQEASSPISVVFSDHSFTLDSIHQAYIQTVTLLMTRVFAPVSVVLFPDRGMPYSEEIRNHFSDQQKNELTGLLKKKQIAEAKRFIFQDTGLEESSKNEWQYLEVRQTMRRIAIFLLEYYSGLPDLAEKNGMENIAEELDKELELLDIHGACEMLSDFMDSCMLFQQEDIADTIQGTVHQAAEFVQEHYYEELTLGGLAEKYHVDSSYFSRMFRKEMAINLLQYIAKIRMDHAKEYIRKDAYNLTEIAFMVGYDDYTYFNKVFRKIEGMSPREYRAEQKTLQFTHEL